MQARWIIIDGYSLLHRRGKPGARPGNLLMARQQLVRKLEEVAGALAERITVVFDGTGKGGREGYEASSIEVFFSPSDKTADTIIERMVHEAGAPAGILIVTSDRLERETTAAAGADTMSCGDFLDLCERTRSQLSRQGGGHHGKKTGSKLGDFFPD
jgi:predicted RNA-binding protein with PIN domain